MKRCFEEDNGQFMADQCGVSVELVNALHNISIAISSGLPICPEKFGKYCLYTADLYERDLPKQNGEEGSWYPMCPSLHKVLFHGAEVIRLLPPSILLGFLGEQAPESSNKDVKKFLLEHARQNSLENRNIDVFKR